jgi:hypothetical protein
MSPAFWHLLMIRDALAAPPPWTISTYVGNIQYVLAAAGDTVATYSHGQLKGSKQEHETYPEATQMHQDEMS